MRRFVSALLGATVLMSSAVQAQQMCASSEDQAVFEVQALKSMLIVLATSCKSDVPYNAFVNRYKPELGTAEGRFNEYFRKTYGRRAQTEHDGYITQLANAQFEVGLKQGGDFCPRNQAIFAEVMTLRDGRDLPAYAAGKDLLPPTLGACAAPAVVPSRATTTRRSAKSRT